MPNIKEICTHVEDCGGCQYQGIPYGDQALLKGKEVLSVLQKKGADLSFLDQPFNPEDLVPAPSPYAYRNKMEYTFGDKVKDGEMTLGMHQKGRHMSIVTVDKCQLTPPDFNLILSETLKFCTARGYLFYHKKSHKGIMRNLIVRKGVRTEEILVNIVTSTQEIFDEASYVELIRSLPLENTLVGVLRTLNDNLSDAVNCDELKTLWGRDYYNERIMNLDFQVHAFSFFQTNIDAVEHLYKEAIGLLDSVEGKTVYDLYCGTGTISQVLARRAKSVVGIELVPEAVAAATETAKANGLDNCTFIAGDVFKSLDRIEACKVQAETSKCEEPHWCQEIPPPDVIVVDPPRMGLQAKALAKIAEYGVPEILYISCNPKTLGEDMAGFQLYGYKARRLLAFDNFPFTKHIEAVILMSQEGI